MIKKQEKFLDNMLLNAGGMMLKDDVIKLFVLVNTVYIVLHSEKIFDLGEITWENIAKCEKYDGFTDYLNCLEERNPEIKDVIAPYKIQITDEQYNKFMGMYEEYLDMADGEVDMSDIFSYTWNRVNGMHMGEYYTPKCVSKIIAGILNLGKECSVYDPCAGIGNLLIEVVNASAREKKHMKLYGQEIEPEAWRLSRLNMVLNGLSADMGQNSADAFTEDVHARLKADIIVAHPPFVKGTWNMEQCEVKEWKYGNPPENRAHFAWMEYMLQHLKEDGRMACIMTNSTLSSRSTAEREIRKNMIEADIVEGVILLPQYLFRNTALSAVIWIFNRNKKRKNRCIFLDTRQLITLQEKHKGIIKEDDVDAVVCAYRNLLRGKTVSAEHNPVRWAVKQNAEIAKNDYDLSPGIYISQDFYRSEEKEEFDMGNSEKELKDLFQKSHELEERVIEQLRRIKHV